MKSRLIDVFTVFNKRTNKRTKCDCGSIRFYEERDHKIPYIVCQKCNSPFGRLTQFDIRWK